MDITELMGELERLGTDQNRKLYRRHGAGEPLFGVSFAHLNTLQKRLKKDQELAEALWATGNTDARSLATMIAEPAPFTAAQLEAWLSDLRYPMLIDLFVRHVASKSPFARERMELWLASESEWTGRAGWLLVGQLAMGDPSQPDALFEGYIGVIEGSIHRARNRTREAMNSALIGIGARSAALRDKAIAAARRIGKVEVDHGETGCKTPDAAGYIEKIWIHKAPSVKGKPAPAPPVKAKPAPAMKASPAPATPVKGKAAKPAARPITGGRRSTP